MKGAALKLSLLLLSFCALTACSPTAKQAAGNNGPANSGPVIAEPKGEKTAASGPLPDDAFKARLSVENPPLFLEAGAEEVVSVRVRNESGVNWPALGQGQYKYQVKLGDHWLAQNAKTVAQDDARAPLPADLKPGAESEITLPVHAPKTPGEYTLELDMVQEDVTWFAVKGSPTLKLRVKVE